MYSLDLVPYSQLIQPLLHFPDPILSSFRHFLTFINELDFKNGPFLFMHKYISSAAQNIYQKHSI